LKEYQNRWYVVGIIGDSEDFRTFGIDRIEGLKIIPETFKVNPKLNPAEMFERTIGLVYSIGTPQKVVLSFTPTQGRYIKTLPLHASQEILVDNEKECRISLYVIPNYELNQEILKHGNAVKVIEPKWLADEIKGILKDALNNYK
jgi:predicted DNA-binding transcriptional regulator YafY